MCFLLVNIDICRRSKKTRNSTERHKSLWQLFNVEKNRLKNALNFRKWRYFSCLTSSYSPEISPISLRMSFLLYFSHMIEKKRCHHLRTFAFFPISRFILMFVSDIQTQSHGKEKTRRFISSQDFGSFGKKALPCLIGLFISSMLSTTFMAPQPFLGR